MTNQVTRYLEFKTVDGSYVVKGGKVNKVGHTLQCRPAVARVSRSMRSFLVHSTAIYDFPAFLFTSNLFEDYPAMR